VNTLTTTMRSATTKERTTPAAQHCYDSDIVVFCFGKPEGAEAFAKRFVGSGSGADRCCVTPAYTPANAHRRRHPAAREILLGVTSNSSVPKPNRPSPLRLRRLAAVDTVMR
jgi:hypothetical protein